MDKHDTSGTITQILWTRFCLCGPLHPILHQLLGILLEKFSGKLGSAHAARLYYSLTHSLTEINLFNFLNITEF